MRQTARPPTSAPLPCHIKSAQPWPEYRPQSAPLQRLPPGPPDTALTRALKIAPSPRTRPSPRSRPRGSRETCSANLQNCTTAMRRVGQQGSDPKYVALALNLLRWGVTPF